MMLILPQTSGAILMKFDVNFFIYFKVFLKLFPINQYLVLAAMKPKLKIFIFVKQNILIVNFKNASSELKRESEPLNYYNSWIS